MLFGWLQLLVLYSTCFTSFFGSLSHTHAIGHNSSFPSSYPMQSVGANLSLRSSSLTSTFNEKQHVYSSIYKSKSKLNVNHMSDDEANQSVVTQTASQSSHPHPVVNGEKVPVQTNKGSFYVSKSIKDESFKMRPIHKLLGPSLQSSETVAEVPGSPSRTKSVARLRQPLNLHDKRSVETKTVSAFLRTDKSNNTKDKKNSKPTTVAMNENSSSTVTDSSFDHQKDNSFISGIGQTDGEMPNNALTSGAMMRGFIVFVGCSVIVIMYLGLKFVCSRRQRRYSKVSRADDLDLLPLTEGDEEDEEIFSANRRS